MDLFLSSPVLGNHVPRTPWLPAPPNSCKAQLHYSMWELMGSVSSIDLFFAQAPLRRRQHITNMCIVCWTGLNALNCDHEYRRIYIPRGVYFRMSRPHSFMFFLYGNQEWNLIDRKTRILENAFGPVTS